MKKIALGFILAASVFVGVNQADAHSLKDKGSEKTGWKYTGPHNPTTTTKYFEATTDSWEKHFKAGASKFRSESGNKFTITQVAVGSSKNFIEHHQSASAGWDARYTPYDVSNDHAGRWRIQFNSAHKTSSWPTVAAHEIGHVFGLDDLYYDYNSSKLMYGYTNGLRYMQGSDRAGFEYVY